jgi:hypothetical protein
LHHSRKWEVNAEHRISRCILTEKHRPRRLEVVDIYNFKTFNNPFRYEYNFKTFNNPNNFCLVLKGRTGEGTRQKAKDQLETKNSID